MNKLFLTKVILAILIIILRILKQKYVKAYMYIFIFIVTHLQARSQDFVRRGGGTNWSSWAMYIYIYIYPESL